MAKRSSLPSSKKASKSHDILVDIKVPGALDATKSVNHSDASKMAQVLTGDVVSVDSNQHKTALQLYTENQTLASSLHLQTIGTNPTFDQFKDALLGDAKIGDYSLPDPKSTNDVKDEVVNDNLNTVNDELDWYGKDHKPFYLLMD